MAYKDLFTNGGGSIASIFEDGQATATGAVTADEIASVNPSTLTGSGTVPLAALAGITHTQLDAAAAIAGSQLASGAAIAAGQIASVNPSTLTGTGTVPLGGLAGITHSQMDAAAGITSGQIASVNPSTLTGSGTVPTTGLPAATTSAQGALQLGTAVGLPDTTAGAAGTSGKAADASHIHVTPSGLWQPADHGLLAWNCDPFLTSTNQAGSAAVLYLMRLKIPTAISVTNVHVGISVVGNTLTNSYLGLYDSTGHIIGTSADQSTAFTGLGLITAALVSGPFPVAAGATVYVGVQVGSASTQPKFACYNSGGANQASVLNANVTGASARVVGISSGNAALPSPITLSSCSVQTLAFWCALS